METMEIKEKKCSQCGEILPVSEFYKCSSSSDGLHSYCKKCHKAKCAESRLNRAVNERNELLAEFTPRELIAELRARGYHGTLEYTQKISL